MDFILEQGSEGYADGVRALLSERGYACKTGINLKLTVGEPGKIKVRFQNGQAEIIASERAFLFRGLMTLVRYLEKNGDQEALELEETVQFDHNGCMVDCSRNCVMSLEAAKAWMWMQAAVGMNTMMLYTEDTYEVPEYPYFGALRGRYTLEELRELDAYAQMMGIELIPCIQALGHLQQPLRWSAMRGLRDTSDIVCVGKEEVYDFIRACIRQTAKSFTTRKVHLGMDEAWTLGLGRYLIQNGYTPKGEIIREHMNRVMEICREEGLEPMIWSDMYFRVHSPSEEYYDVPFDEDMRSAELPPEGMTLVYWDYYHMDPDFYRNYLRMHRKLTDRILFAGGGWTWNGMAPDIKAACAVTNPAYRACREEQVKDVIYTLWGDDGTETPSFAALGPVLLCAEYGFGEIPDQERVGELFEFLTGCSYEKYCALGEFDLHTDELTDENLEVNPSKGLFYQDLLLGVYDGQTEGVHYGSYFEKLWKKIGGAQELGETDHGADRFGYWGAEMRAIMEYYRAFARALAVKADLGLQIKEAYEEKDRETLEQLARTVIPACISRVERCRCLRERIWKREGKMSGWEVLDIRFRALAGRMESAAGRILEYTEGRTDALSELEEQRVAVFPRAAGDKRLEGGYTSWINVVSASPLAWNWMPM